MIVQLAVGLVFVIASTPELIVSFKTFADWVVKVTVDVYKSCGSKWTVLI